MYQFHTQVPSEERSSASETTLHLGISKGSSYVSTTEGGREKRGKARLSTSTGPYYTNWGLIASHLRDVWEDCGIFNARAGKCLSELINLTERITRKSHRLQKDFKSEERGQEITCTKCNSDRKGKLAYK